MSSIDSEHFDRHQSGFSEKDIPSLKVSEDLHEHADERIIAELFKFIDFENLTLEGKKVYIPGCGTSFEAIPFARRKAFVTGIDISAKQVDIAKIRANYNGCDQYCDFICGDALHTSIPDNCIDIIVAHAVIHHFDYDEASQEFHRILKPGGFFIFSEPFAENPILNFIRNKVPYPGKHRTPDEHPLTYTDIKKFSKRFSKVFIKEIQLLSMIERFVGKKDYIKTLTKIDSWLTKWFPFTRRFCRCVLIKGYR